MKRPEISLDIQYHPSSSSLPRNDSERFESAAAWVCGKLKLRSLTANIALVSDESIHEVNRKHLDHDWPTDVVSFVFNDAGGNVDGEIVASYETAERLAKKAGWATEDELLLYVVHGFLHLAGLDDIAEAERQEMRACEQECLMHLGVAGAERHVDRWQDVSY